MRTFSRLHVPVLFAVGLAAAAAHQVPGDDRLVWLNLSSDLENSEAPQPPSPPNANLENASQDGSSPTRPLHFVATPARPPIPPGSRPPDPTYTTTALTSSSTPPVPTVVTYTPPALPAQLSNMNSSSPGNLTCTGCILAARKPLTTWFDDLELSNLWTSTVVTETIVTEYITYMNNNTIETVLTEERTLNHTTTVTGADDQVITHTTPTFTVEVTEGVYLQFDAGPTYVIYNNLVGGPDQYVNRFWTQYNRTQRECVPKRTSLSSWQPAKTDLHDWNYFVATHTDPLPNVTRTEDFVQLPTQVLQYLGQEPAIQSQFHGLNLSSCSLRPPSFSKSLELSPGAPGAPAPTISPPQAPPPFISPIEVEPPLSTPAGPTASPITSTFISTTYETTSVHNTVRGCLRCLADSPVSVKIAPPASVAAGGEEVHNFKPQPDKTIGNGANPINTPGPIQNEPGRPDDHDQDHPNLPPPVIIIGGQTLHPGETRTVDGVPVVYPSAPPTGGEEPKIIVGGSTVVYEIAPQPTPPVLTVGGGTIAANLQGEFVFGTHTLKPGGAPVIVNGNTVGLGSDGVAIVNGVPQAIAGPPAPGITAAPPLMIGGQAVYVTQVGGSAAYFVAPGKDVGASCWVVNDGTTAYVPAPGQTVAPGSTLTISGTTYYLPQGAPGGVVVVNGVTSTMATGGVAVVVNGVTSTVAPGGIIVVNGVTSTIASGGVVVNGVTSTMAPGDVIVINGVASTMASGGIVVVDGVATTLTPDAVITPAPALTINDLTYTPTVRDGTTEYALGNGTTLAPGSTIEMDGTTYALDESGTALVINGQTSTIPKLPKSTSASVTSSSVAMPTTTGRNAGDLIASGVGQTSKGAGASLQNVGLDKWVESFVVGAAGWLMMLL